MKKSSKTELKDLIKRNLLSLKPEQQREILWVLLKQNLSGKAANVTWLLEETGIFLDQQIALQERRLKKRMDK